MVKNDDFGPADLPQVHRLAGGLGGERVLHQPLPNDLPGDGAVFKIPENLNYAILTAFLVIFGQNNAKFIYLINIINILLKFCQKSIIPRLW